ncbi:M20 family metallo-hydrolase [Bacillus sp. SG-1]|uniref:M20 family metallo-hydrolase n=1 Tax=Bacillus sp. SG-1 TaxID=161544 RepID=UPI0001543B68|nr:M20 family metallo-hydrolase [Bacillus sp. SG-1]EDL66373.1 N-carbamoyl-L-amino acid amidohydrolase [Bacillus sp. SG-1]
MIKWLDETLKAFNLTETMKRAEGFTRLGYTEEEDRSIEVFKATAEELGLTIIEDQAGNIIARWEPENRSGLPAVATGSHLDTVSMGGGYDGAAGVLCSLGAVKKLKEEGFQPKHPIEVICFRSEESARFGISTIGSKAMSGLINKEIGSVEDEEGTTIREAVEKTGFKWGEITGAERESSEIKSFVELHIEQGTQIEDHQKQYGVVHGVACPIRLKVKIEGKAGHTGTTPMGNRKDALVAAAPLISDIEVRATQMSNESEQPIVATVSTIHLQPNVMNVIPSLVELGIDIRSVDDGLKSSFEEMVKEKCKEIEQQYNVKIVIDTLVNNPSVSLDSEVQEKLLQVGDNEGYSSLVMNSGAGHDVMNMAKKWPSGLIFIPCKEGLSHHPDEYATLEDLKMGVELLAGYLKLEAGG